MITKCSYTPEAILCLRTEMNPEVFCTFVKEIISDERNFLEILNHYFWNKLQILNLILLGEIEVIDYSEENDIFVKKFEYETKPLKLQSLTIIKETMSEFPLYFMDLSMVNMGWSKL